MYSSGVGRLFPKYFLKFACTSGSVLFIASSIVASISAQDPSDGKKSEIFFLEPPVIVKVFPNLISHSELGYYIGLILIVVGVFYIIFIIVKYNGKLISFKK